MHILRKTLYAILSITYVSLYTFVLGTGLLREINQVYSTLDKISNLEYHSTTHEM